MNEEQKNAAHVLQSALGIIMEHEHCEVLVVVRACCNAHTVICTTDVPADVDELMKTAAHVVKTVKPEVRENPYNA